MVGEVAVVTAANDGGGEGGRKGAPLPSSVLRLLRFVQGRGAASSFAFSSASLCARISVLSPPLPCAGRYHVLP